MVVVTPGDVVNPYPEAAEDNRTIDKTIQDNFRTTGMAMIKGTGVEVTTTTKNTEIAGIEDVQTQPSATDA